MPAVLYRSRMNPSLGRDVEAMDWFAVGSRRDKMAPS